MRYTERIIDKYGEENIFTKYIPNNQKLKDKKLCEFEDIEEEFEIDSMEDLRDRLTKYKFLANHEMSCVDVNSYNLMLEDLNNYHKLEYELDIDLNLLPTLLKIKKGDKIYVIDGTLVEAEVTDNSLINGKLMVFSRYGYNGIEYTPVCYYSEYGKTWALTKDELNR